MKVTNLAKNLAKRFPCIKKQGFNLPTATYSYQAPRQRSTTAVVSGEDFHHAFSEFANGAWIAPKDYYPSLAICDALADLGIREIQSEVPVARGNLRGIVDIVGTAENGSPVIVELKTTLGEYALDPRPSELFQLAIYANLLGIPDPQLACIRLALKEQRLSVFETPVDDVRRLMKIVKSSISLELAA